MSTFSEKYDPVSVPAGSPPRGLFSLIRRLGVVGRPEAEQKAAVLAWLETNEPQGFIPIELKRRGWAA